MSKKQVTLASLPELFGVSHVTVWNWRKRKDFPKQAFPARPVKHGRQPIMFNYVDLRAWARAQGLAIKSL